MKDCFHSDPIYHFDRSARKVYVGCGECAKFYRNYQVRSLKGLWGWCAEQKIVLPLRLEQVIIDHMRKHPAWIDSISFDEFTDMIPREYRVLTGTKCHALPARAIAWRYPDGCQRSLGHDGSHFLRLHTAERADEKARVMADKLLQRKE